MPDLIPGARYRIAYEGTYEKVTHNGHLVLTGDTDRARRTVPADATFDLIAPPAAPEPTVPGTVIRDANGRVAVLPGSNGTWFCTGSLMPWAYRDFRQPVQVLYTPEVTE